MKQPKIISSTYLYKFLQTVLLENQRPGTPAELSRGNQADVEQPARELHARGRGLRKIGQQNCVLHRPTVLRVFVEQFGLRLPEAADRFGLAGDAAQDRWRHHLGP